MAQIRKKESMLIVCILLLLVFSGLSIYYGRYVKDNLSAVSARYETAVVTPKVILIAIENLGKDIKAEVPEITLWNRLEKETIINKITELSADTNIIETYGDMSQVIPMTFIDGNYVYKDDQKGCVLDSETAYNLFGTTNAVNNIVVWKEKEYVVRGVARTKDTIMLVQIADDKHQYTNIEAVYRNRDKKYIIDNQGQLLENLLILNGMPKPNIIMDGNFISGLLGAIYRLPIWIISLGIVLVLMKKTYRYRKSIFLCSVSGLAVLVVALLLIKITRLNIHIPSQLIPTKWSDFDFYVNRYKEVQENIQGMKNSEMMPKDILRSSFNNNCIIFTICNILTLLLLKSQKDAFEYIHYYIGRWFLKLH